MWINMFAAEARDAHPSRSGRKRLLVIPREHGAWGILLVPLFTGACAGVLVRGPSQGLVVLTVLVLALFWLRTPIEAWAGIAPIRARTPGEFRLVRALTVLLLIIAVSGLTWLLRNGQNRALIWIGCAAAFDFGIQLLVRRIWKNARAAAQIVGAAGLTSTAPAAYYVVTGHLNTASWSLWAANLLFAANQIQYVQLRIRTARVANRAGKVAAGRGFLAQQLLLTALLAAACSMGDFRWYGAAAFLPVLIRGFAWFVDRPKPLVIHSLGKRELAHACIFGVLLVASMRIA